MKGVLVLSILCVLLGAAVAGPDVTLTKENFAAEVFTPGKGSWARVLKANLL
jgi:hypothetical protein